MKKKSRITIGFLALMLLLSIKLASMHMEKGLDDAAAMHYSQFPKDIQLTGEGFAVDDELIRYPFRIRQQGD